MPIISPKRRALCLTLVVAMLCPNPALARVVPDIDLGTISVLVKGREPVSCGGGTNPTTGKVTYQAPDRSVANGSPGIDPSPSFHSGNTDLSAWGLGWTSDVDHSITLNANRTITWTNGQGVHVSYLQTAGSTTTPVYTPRSTPTRPSRPSAPRAACRARSWKGIRTARPGALTSSNRPRF